MSLIQSLTSWIFAPAMFRTGEFHTLGQLYCCKLYQEINGQLRKITTGSHANKQDIYPCGIIVTILTNRHDLFDTGILFMD